MGLLSVILIGITLSMDCLAASICISCVQKVKKSEFINIPLHFGIFQAGMVFIGYLVGKFFESYVKSIDHWIAFGILAYIGGNMILQNLKGQQECELIKNEKDRILLSIATSIDALMIGVTFNLIDSSVFSSAIIIGIITYFLSLGGLILGKRIAESKLNYASMAGGIVLVLLGIKILVEHLF